MNEAIAIRFALDILYFIYNISMSVVTRFRFISHRFYTSDVYTDGYFIACSLFALAQTILSGYLAENLKSKEVIVPRRSKASMKFL